MTQVNLDYFAIPWGFVGIRKSGMPSRYCIKITYSGDIEYFDRLTGKIVTEQQIREYMKYQDEYERQVLLNFFEKYPTDEDKRLFWATRMQRSARTYTKKFARELKEEIERRRLKANEGNSLQG
jgi:hypothetical protein